MENFRNKKCTKVLSNLLSICNYQRFDGGWKLQLKLSVLFFSFTLKARALIVDCCCCCPRRATITVDDPLQANHSSASFSSLAVFSWHLATLLVHSFYYRGSHIHGRKEGEREEIKWMEKEEKAKEENRRREKES